MLFNSPQAKRLIQYFIDFFRLFFSYYNLEYFQLNHLQPIPLKGYAA